MERTIENVRKVRGLVSNLFYFMIVIVGLGVLYHTIKTGFSIGIELGEAIIGIATLMLAFATFYLAFSDMEEGIRNREQNEIEAENDRRRLRLKEQLEGLYSPLMAYIDIIEDKYQHTYREGDIMPLMKTIRTKYEYLAEPDLLDYLREYYNTEISGLDEKQWNKLIMPIIDSVGTGYSQLSLDYLELIGKGS